MEMEEVGAYMASLLALPFTFDFPFSDIANLKLLNQDILSEENGLKRILVVFWVVSVKLWTWVDTISSVQQYRQRV